MPTSSSIIGRNLQFIRPAGGHPLVPARGPLRLSAVRGAARQLQVPGQITRRQVVQGTIPGWNNLLDPFPIVATDAVSVNYNLNQTTFVEGTFGRAWNKQGTYQTDPISDARTAGLANFPLLFPDANVIDPDVLRATEALNKGQPPAPYWDGTRVWKAPNFSWGNRIVRRSTPARRPTSVEQPPRAPDEGSVDQPDESRGPAHDQDRVLHQPQHQAGVRRRLRHRTSGA